MKTLILGGVDDAITPPPLPSDDRSQKNIKRPRRNSKDNIPTNPNHLNKLYIDLGSWQTRISSSSNTPIVVDSLIATGGDSKKLLKSPFERDILVNFIYLEKLLDPILASLCLPTLEQKYDLFVTAPFGYPLQVQLKEFLLSTYSVIVKEITIIPDWLSAFSKLNKPTGIVVNFGYHSIHIAKINNFKEIDWIRRLELGSFQLAETLSRIMVLKYSNCRLSIPQCLALIPKACFVALDYHAELERLLNDSNEWVCLKQQFIAPNPVVSEKEKKRGLSEERKQAMSEKLQERIRQQRLEKLESKEAELRELRKSLIGGEDSKVELEKNIKIVERQIYEIKKKLDPSLADAEFDNQKESEVYDYSLLVVPDSDLSPEQIKEKRRIRLIKASIDSRLKLKQQKEAEQQKQKEAQELDDQRRVEDFETWKRDKFSERLKLIEQVKLIQKERADLSGRKASGKRLRAIIKDSQGKSGDPNGDADQGNVNDDKSDLDDGFGLDDSDWNIYRSKEAEEEQLTSQLESLSLLLLNIESQLETHAKSDFDSVVEEEVEANKTILDKLGYFLEPLPGCYYMGIERIRILEALFQPSAILGIDQAGIVEILINSISLSSNKPTDNKVDLYLTGGFSGLSGLIERLQKDLMANLPVGTLITISKVGDELSAWRGLQNFTDK